MPDLILAGAAIVDVPVVPADDSVFSRVSTPAEHIMLTTGGDAMNEAMVLSRLGKQVRLITRIGIVMFLVSIAMLIYCLVRYFTGHTVAGWSSLAVSIWAIGVVGEYIGKFYLEKKARPRYRIETDLDDREAEL